ncbi:hypothetical protein HanLR1_Chr17g0664961 [Helianthus annuus]|nr:hypothetical protein HanLR1_Chr17g0664961 [Helianthus annuus]
MAQQQRRENKTDEREIHVEKDKVPKMASHFESLTVKDSGDQPVVHHVVGTVHGAAGDQSEAKDQYKGPSLEEISKYRGVAQQNSMDAIRAAEEQYRKSKEMSTRAGETGRVTGGQVIKNNVSTTSAKGGQIGQQAEERLSSATQTAAENAARASDYTVMKSEQAKESLSSATQTAAEKAARAKDYAHEKGQQTGQQAKESLSSAAQTAAEKAARAKDYTLEKGQQTGQQAKESLSSAAQTAAEKAARAKDYTLEKGQQTC